jgi:hypothetical protein
VIEGVHAGILERAVFLDAIPTLPWWWRPWSPDRATRGCLRLRGAGYRLEKSGADEA